MKGLFIGSFDPFTIGHYNILKQAEELFDVTICIARNPNKQRFFSELSCANAIKSIDGKKREIILSDKLTTDIMNEFNCTHLIRGFRNTSDLIYEDLLLKQYKLLNSQIKVIYLTSDSAISSSFVRELYTREKDISKYVPYNVSLLKKSNMSIRY